MVIRDELLKEASLVLLECDFFRKIGLETDSIFGFKYTSPGDRDCPFGPKDSSGTNWKILIASKARHT